MLVARGPRAGSRRSPQELRSPSVEVEVLPADLADRAQLAAVEARRRGPGAPGRPAGQQRRVRAQEAVPRQRRRERAADARRARHRGAAAHPRGDEGDGRPRRRRGHQRLQRRRLPGPRHLSAQPRPTSPSCRGGPTRHTGPEGCAPWRSAPASPGPSSTSGWTSAGGRRRRGCGSTPTGLVREALADFDAGRSVSVPDVRYKVLTAIARAHPGLRAGPVPVARPPVTGRLTAPPERYDAQRPGSASATSRSSCAGSVVLQPRSWSTLPAPWKSLEPVTTRPRSRAIPRSASRWPASWSWWSTSMPGQPQLLEPGEPLVRQRGRLGPAPRVGDHRARPRRPHGAEHLLERGGVAAARRPVGPARGTGRTPRHGRPRRRGRPGRRRCADGRWRRRRRRDGRPPPRRCRCPGRGAGRRSAASARRAPRAPAGAPPAAAGGRVGQVGEQVDAASGVLAADLHAAHQRDAGLDRRLARLVPPLGGVVVGQREDVEPGGRGGAHDLPRRQRAVRPVGVGVEVDAHPDKASEKRRGTRSAPSTSPAPGHGDERQGDQLRAELGDVVQLPRSGSRSAADAGRSTSQSHRPSASPASTARSSASLPAARSRPATSARRRRRPGSSRPAVPRPTSRPGSVWSTPPTRAPSPTPGSSVTTVSSTTPSSSLAPVQVTNAALGGRPSTATQPKSVTCQPGGSGQGSQVGSGRESTRYSANAS